MLEPKISERKDFKKICFVMPFHILERRMGGAEVQAWLLAKELSRRGYKVSYVAQSIQDKEGTNEIIDGVEIKWIRYASKLPLASCFHYYRSLRDAKPDLIIQRGSTAPITLAAGLYCRKNTAKFIWMCSDNASPFRWTFFKHQIEITKNRQSNILKSIVLLVNSLVLDLVRHLGMRHISTAFTQNDYQKNSFKKHYGLDSYRMISGHEIPEQVYPPDKKLSGGIVLWVGNLGTKKSPEKFIELAQLDKNKSLRFVMIGTKEDKLYVKRLFCNTPANLEWLGHLTFEETTKWFAQAAFFVNTSASEGFPNTYVQAWLQGTPVFALEVDPDGIILENKLGYVHNNLNKLLEKIDFLENQVNDYVKISNHVREYASVHNSIEVVTDNFLAIILKKSKPEAPKKAQGQPLAEIINYGIMMESLELKGWERECIIQVRKLENTRLKLIILTKNSEKKPSLFQKYFWDYKTIFFNIYSKFLFKPKSLLNSSNLILKNVPKIHCFINHGTDGTENFIGKDIEEIRSAKLDFIILFSELKNLKGEVLKSSKYGIWLFCHGDIDKYRLGPCCFWEIYNDEGMTVASIYRLSSEPHKISIIRKGFYKTIKSSYKNNFDYVHFQSAKLLKEACEDINNKVIKFIDKQNFESSEKFRGLPDNIAFIDFFIKMLRNKIAITFVNLFKTEIWNIGYVNSSIEAFIKNNKCYKITWLMSSARNQFFADPFIIDFNNNYYVLFEDFLYKDKKAGISAIMFDGMNRNNKIIPCIRKPYHLSYPFVFKYRDEVYLIVEEWRSFEVSLYKSLHFPSGWEKVDTLIRNISAVDSTMFRFNELWWLAFTIREENPDLKLYLYYSKDLFSGWQPHKRNPVKTDISSSRPAGNLFERDGNLFRPSQDCSDTKCMKIAINRVIKLTPDDFQEDTIAIIKPNPRDEFRHGIHTINSLDNLIVIDGKKMVFSLRHFSKIVRQNLPFDFSFRAR